MQPERSNATQTGSAVNYDAGLHAHLQRIYNRMTLGVLVTALTAYFVSMTPALMSLFLTPPIVYVVMFAPLAVVWFGFNPMTMSSQKLQMSFFAISVLYGISFSVIFLAFTGENIARAFFIATGMFAGLSIFGYSTKKNLDGLMSFAIMGVWGVLIMSLLNGFIFKSEGLFDLISAVGILAFAGITAWQTQAMKEMYHPAAGDEANSRMGWSAALTLYISFIALFQHILHFTSQR
ncbi:MAG: Bax inhibitor-1/YccA family protein [Rhodospirillales bacterium]|nr:Bax inhibitor-1/YccA family protein [Rhodospirillales bacterium]MCB9996982.1 Bax inhibitor-1/YccA family protein [Rhodospirillales bacterium]